MTAKEDFESIYDKYCGTVKTYFQNKVPQSEIDDLVQQTFLKLWICFRDKRTIRSYKAMLITIAKSVLVDYYRKRSTHISFNDLSEMLDIPNDNNLQSFVEEKLILLSLSPTDKIILTMKCDGYKSKEISKVVGISASGVRTRMQKIRKILKDEF